MDGIDVVGVLGAIGIVCWFIYATVVKLLEFRQGKTTKRSLEHLEDRVKQLESQQDASFRKRLEVLEEIIVSEEFDLKSKFRQLKKTAIK